MPSRSDLFVACKTILTRAGVVTVWRGPFVPHLHGDLLSESYPIAGYLDSPDQQRTEQGGAGSYAFRGDVEFWLWVFTGEDAGPLLQDPGPWKQLDDLHDRIMDHVSDAYNGKANSILPNTISLYAQAYEPFNFYDLSPHLGAGLRLGYEINYGPKPH